MSHEKESQASQSEPQSNKPASQTGSSRRLTPERLLGILGTLYGLTIAGSLAYTIFLTYQSTQVDPKVTQAAPTVTPTSQLDVKEYVERQVDRSYNRFFNQFNFALVLIGTSVWVFQNSVISQLREQLEKPVQKAAETTAREEAASVAQTKVAEYLREEKVAAKIAKLFSADHKLQDQLRKNEIIVQLSMSLPLEEVFFQLRTSPEVQRKLGKIVEKLDSLKKESESRAKALSESLDTYLDLTFTDHIALGDAYFCLGKYQKAKLAYKKVTDEKETENYPKALFGLGSALWQQGLQKQKRGQEASYLFNQAIESYKNAIEADHYYFVAHVNKGLALRRLTNSDDEGLNKGIDCFDDALRIEPNYYRAWYNAACYYALLSEPNFTEALRCLKKAFELAPSLCKDLAETDPDFDKIRNDEDFQRLFQRTTQTARQKNESSGIAVEET